MEEEEQPVCGQASQTKHKVHGLQYHHRIMAFLSLQLDRVEGLTKPPIARQEEWESFHLCVHKGHRLLDKHARPFDIRTFYLTDDASTAVHEICRYLGAMAEKWQVNCRMELRTCVPHDCMEEDRKYLHRMLAYILKGTENEVDEELLHEWFPIKCRHEEGMRSLQIEVIREDGLVLKEPLGKGGYGHVFKAEWNSTDVAVKKSLREGDLPIEVFARFVKEVMLHAKLSHPNIAQVYATTPSGWLVMEMADKDLGIMCRGMRLHWSAVRNLLQQAVKGLCHLHSLSPPVVHSDVKTANFLIFGKEPSSCKVKVTDFGLAVEADKSRSKTVRLGQGTLEYMAPELFNGKPTSLLSDVCSLGVIMYEVLTGEHPYGIDELGPNCDPHAVLLCKKLHTMAEPCKVGPEHCPEEMQSFMRKCISTDPSKRPTMEEISQYLQQLPLVWIPPSLSADEPLQARQKNRGRDGPKSVSAKGIAEQLDISDVQRDTKLRSNWERSVHKLLTWLNKVIDIVIMFEDAGPGCVVFPMQIEFPDGHSAELFKQQIRTGSNLLFQADLNLIAYQPRLELGFRDELYVADCQVDELESEVHRIIRECSEVVDVKYSCQMMHFLQTEIGRMAGCSLKLPDGGAELNWKEDAAVVLHYLRFALSLLKQHTFVDLNNLQKTTDTRMAIKRVLGHTASFVSKWGFHETVHVQAAVGAELLQHDREIMEKCLGYLFEGTSCSFEEFATTHRQEWEELKQSFSEERRKLEVIAKEEIKWLRFVDEDVHHAEWRNAKVAVKQVIPVSQNVMNLEDYAKFYTWMLNRTILDPEHVVRLHGVVRSGAVLMELADGNLVDWCASQPRTSGEEGDVRMKVGVLLQAARALRAVHHLGIIYGDLKSSKFLVFTKGGSDATVKISQLKLSAEPWEQEAWPNWTGRWTAKELYEGSPPSLASDVFSFGVIMYEVMIEELPYGQEAMEAEIMDKKFKGLEPLPVPCSSEQAWPNGLLELMKTCCSLEPEQRPSMVSVCSSLEALYLFAGKKQPTMTRVAQVALKTPVRRSTGRGDLFHLTVRSLAHTDKTFRVRKTDTIYDIKWKLQNLTGLRTWDQQLYYTPPGTHARRIPLGIGGWRVDVGDRITLGNPPKPGATWVGIIGARPKPAADGMPTHHADAIQFAASPTDNIFDLMDQHGYVPPKWLRRTVEPGWEGVDIPACLKVTPVVATTKKVKVLPAGAAASCGADGGDLGLPVDGSTFVEFYNDVVDAIKGVEREEKMTKTRLVGRAGDRIEFPSGLVVEFWVARRMEELVGYHGRFPLLRVQDYKGSVPRAWRRRGGMFFGMLRRERMRICLEADARRPVAVKVALGGVNVITGQPWEEGLSNKTHNYIVCDPFSYIDGFATGEGGIRHFKAMKTMKKYSLNSELLKDIGSAAIRLEAYPVMRTDVSVSSDHLRPFESPIDMTQTPAQAGLIPGDVFYMTSHEFGMRPSTLVDFVDTCDYLLLEDASQMDRCMRLADYGIDRDCVIELIIKRHCSNESNVGFYRPRTMKRVQQQFRDSVGLAFWDTRHPECAFVSMLNTIQYKAIAGRDLPQSRLAGPKRFGHRHFDVLDEVLLTDAALAQFRAELEADEVLECVADVKEVDGPLLERNLCNRCADRACCNELLPCRHKLCAKCTGALTQGNVLCPICLQNVDDVRTWSETFTKADYIMQREANAVVCLHMN